LAVNIRWGGFAADGTLIMSDQNFRRFFDPFPQSDQPGADQTERGRGLQVAEKLRRILPKDVVVVLTQEQIIAHDRDYWISATSTGFIFWDGVAVSCIVGVVIISDSLH